VICFQKVRWKNFLSTGNNWTEVNLTEHDTNIIVGANGAGKSTILDALTFSLFNKPFRKITKPQLINTTNERGGEVEVEFSVRDRQYKVFRGLKPNKFEIWIDGKMQDQFASANDQQKHFEQNILKLNYKSFTQIVILGSSTFVPFMQLTASSRREVIEDLLDIKIFSAMSEHVKVKLRSLRDEVRTLELKKDSLLDKVEMQEQFIKQIERTSKDDIKEKQSQIKKIANEANEYISKNVKLSKELETLDSQLLGLSDVTKSLRTLSDLRGKIKQKVSAAGTEYDFFNDNVSCPTCTQSLKEEFRVNKIAELKTSVRRLQTGLDELEAKIKNEEERELRFTNLSQEVTSLTHGISQNNTRISGLQRQSRDLESEIQRITEQLANRNTEHEKLAEYQHNLAATYERVTEQKELISEHDFAFGLLKDSGVKKTIIKKYLPLINQQVNRYLQMMDFYINFTLDEEFNESIESPIHEDFSYASFSEGEKMRIDLALLFTWREIAAYKNSTNTNLLIMDEVFDSSLDGSGNEDFLKIIRFVIKGANIFVISHKEGMFDKFDNVIRFEKVKGFSRIMPNTVAAEL
jgi:DNA repair exonuclease SbcCD ATPase subunit